MAVERLQKILAKAGVASRRAAEGLITDGRVRVNGRIVRELGHKADAHLDRIEVDGKRVVGEKPVYYLLHKPREVVTTLDDPEGRPTVAGLLRRIPERVYPVGRLDYHTSGVLLVTNDGAMAQALSHPRRRVPKTYIAKFAGRLDVPELDALRNGVTLDDGHRTAPAEVFVSREERGNSWVQITITEGKNRQIHRMGDAIGRRVQRLVRIAYAGLNVEGLAPGQHRPLKANELHKLKRDFLNPEKRSAQKQKRAAAAQAMYGTSVVPPFQLPEADAEVAAPASKRPQPEARGPRRGGRPAAGASKKRSSPRSRKGADDPGAAAPSPRRKRAKGEQPTSVAKRKASSKKRAAKGTGRKTAAPTKKRTNASSAAGGKRKRAQAPSRKKRFT